MEDLIEVCVGKRYRVMMTPQVAKKFEKSDARQRSRCLQWMKRFAEDGDEYLDDEKFKFEGRFSTGQKAGTKVAISAFKAWQLRVYGGVAVEGVFIATEIDTAKKQNAADRATLEAAARKLATYM
ncbi:hypothetical protein RsS62_50650 [Rhizobium dioscoreae]|uniref:hypothetical protein n=1 Tax=Rhizobium TaxID=379 RepID=UPI0012610B5E|nr:hypothetical protein [Rhizobium dioscoreae]GES45813.1 hypothetical protein RsS62_50650 [Rhizobium dioscoreae]